MDNWLKNNNIIRIIALFIGVMLWLVVSMDANNISTEKSSNLGKSEYFFETEVIPIYDNNQYVVEMLTDKVKVTLKGDVSLINKIRGGINIDNSMIYVDLENYSVGTYEVPINNKGFPSGIEVNIEPSIAHLSIDVKHSKEFEILVEKLGIEKDGFKTGEPIINPKKVYVSGTKKQIEQIVYVKAYVNIDKANNYISQQIPLRAIDNNGNIVDVTIMPSATFIQIPVSSPYLTVPLTYRIDKHPPEGYAVESVNLYTKDVTLYGDRDILSKYQVYSGMLLDLSGYTENKAINIDLTNDEGLIKVEPSSVKVEVNIVKSVTRNFSIPIDINGLGGGFKPEIIGPNNMTGIKLEGAPNILNFISNNDLQAYIDISNLPIGEHKVLIKYNLPVFTKNLSGEQYVDVIITKFQE